MIHIIVVVVAATVALVLLERRDRHAMSRLRTRRSAHEAALRQWMDAHPVQRVGGYEPPREGRRPVSDRRSETTRLRSGM